MAIRCYYYYYYYYSQALCDHGNRQSLGGQRDIDVFETISKRQLFDRSFLFDYYKYE